MWAMVTYVCTNTQDSEFIPRKVLQGYTAELFKIVLGAGREATKIFFGPFCGRPVCTQSAVLRPFSWPATSRSSEQRLNFFFQKKSPSPDFKILNTEEEIDAKIETKYEQILIYG
ncbi:hypothetical protein BpHYR1_046661 [Brachionus plicatilis]|uniref:Uncharacterized protein n=1 Tax=Brachionus plicatilis TaxID=10195 RepID=A0A3M7RVZ5_BRAPC|nr:hypothetical protein BpHYR1_046661 [Brachionus plicatilis]